MKVPAEDYLKGIIDVFQYRLKPGSGAAFHTLMTEQSVPLHQRSGLKILRHGNSLHDADCYYLVRAFSSESVMEESLNDFYGDPLWIEGPRNAILNLILESHRVVLPDDQ
ncbi:NIPSNAP family protein [Dryocola clanedunensis]|uniref:NIPSNAP family protein n=1 Tax=Cedecea sulfonylureivorans TaxID=3051154 RepID=UPI001F460CC9|nr:NIPSNAP family protein [Cedecea sulfonylureivorans]